MKFKNIKPLKFKLGDKVVIDTATFTTVASLYNGKKGVIIGLPTDLMPDEITPEGYYTVQLDKHSVGVKEKNLEKYEI